MSIVPFASRARRRVFIDSNVPLYMLSADVRKADIAQRILEAGGFASVQVMNEIAAVLHGKMRIEWTVVHDLLAAVRATCLIGVATLPVHERALSIAERHGIGIHDAQIVAAALDAGCSVLYTEDLQHGQIFERRLRVTDPFRIA